MNKANLRAALLSKRKQLTTSFVKAKSQRLIEHLLNTDIFKQAHTVALYLPLNGEVDLQELLKTSHKKFYLPSIQGEHMQFRLYKNNLPLMAHQFGFMQPAFIDDLTQPQLDLCLVPLVGFDRQGHRIGMGGGYYDRYFQYNTNTELVGVAYAFQQAKQLPVDHWDVKLHHIITEQGLITP